MTNLIKEINLCYSHQGGIVVGLCHLVKTQACTYGLANADKGKLANYSCNRKGEIIAKIMYRVNQATDDLIFKKLGLYKRQNGHYCVYICTNVIQTLYVCNFIQHLFFPQKLQHN